MDLTLANCRIRPFESIDAPSMARHANNRRIWINLRDRFPHPYTEDDARRFIAHVNGVQPVSTWAIDVGGEAAGAIGIERQHDVERVSAEIGYWLGEPFWGRGIASAAVRSVTAAAFERFDLTRIFALPFADNVSSIRVLEKAGYTLEGRLRRSAIKDGVIRDQLQFAVWR